MDTEDFQHDDNELIAQVQSGNIAAYEEIVKRHQSTIATQMRRFSHDINDIEELTQQVFINAYLSIDNYKPKAPFLHWLKTIASRTGYNFWRDQTKKPKFVNIEDWDGAESCSKIESINAEEAGIKLEALLQELLPNERYTITLIYLEGKAIKEVARLTGWSEGKVKMLAHRGRKKLKELLIESRRIEHNG